MARGEPQRAGAWAWLLVAVPAALCAGETSAPVDSPDPELLEFLAEEPAVDEDLGKALMTDRLDAEIESAARGRKVKDDAEQRQ